MPLQTTQKEDVKDDWYKQLQSVTSKVPQHDLLVIMGDMNVKVGSDNANCEQAVGTHACGIVNDNGERLINFSMTNNTVIGWTIFEHKNIHKLTWKTPDGVAVNQIDHVIINNKWRVHREADVSSDDYLVVAIIKL